MSTEMRQAEFHTQWIKSQRAKWALEKTIPPLPIILPTRSQLNATYQGLLANNAKALGGKLGMRTMTMGQSPESSHTSVSKLQEVHLRNLLAPHRHKGRYLLCRTFLPATRMVAINLYLEDRMGDVITASIYNLPGLFQISDEAILKAYIPEGQIFLIREPWAKLDGSLTTRFLRIDSPSDLVFLDATDPLLQNKSWKTPARITRGLSTAADDFRIIGNNLFQKGHFLLAARAWSRGLRNDPTLHSLHLNRAQAYIKLRWFGAAIADASHVLSRMDLSPAIREKATFRAACAEYGRQQYDKALARFQSLEAGAEKESRIAQCKERLHEAETGKVSMISLLEARESLNRDIDVADWTSAAIRVDSASARGGGRRIIASRDIQCGELLLVSKAFAAAFDEEMDKDETLLVVDFQASKMMTATKVAVLHKITTQLMGNASDTDTINALYAGPSFPPPPNTIPSSQEIPSAPIEPYFQRDIDVCRLEQVLSHNSFAPDTDERNSPLIENPFKGPTALFVMPSLFNHSCIPNASWQCYGDVMLIRSVQAIKCGSEVTISYCGKDFESRQKLFKALLGCECDCSKCAMERDHVSATQNIYNLYKENVEKKHRRMEMGKHSWGSRKEVTGYLQKIVQAHLPLAELPSMELYCAHLDVMQCLEREANVKVDIPLLFTAIRHGFDALQAAGIADIDSRTTQLASGKTQKKVARVLPFSKGRLPTEVPFRSLVVIAIHISASFVSVSEQLLAERWLRGAWWLHEMWYGGGLSFFNRNMQKALQGVPLPASVEYVWE
ncbi:hypothetical protein SISSUDRAFT_841212 [Sistotremastrum suecicum HHB10207 ss-3]|uniref:SET domain-containing protein n=1 Tax=Sistotremastrum suecicum HHB10207 ss-3 TaxID=1314776 RepID=A0A166CJH7_9AGAM|nr:hypothetical protein SISSUDRAFT_841212 [Sistotremastrum suecicum HHB10207 ss-3]